MARVPRLDDLGGSFRRIFGEGTVSGMGEGELLQRFATLRDPVALEALVARHGPMVLGVCRRVLVNWHASEDAFQATFLVLARRAATIRDPDRLGPWLHGVAHRVALRARAERARRQAREQTGTDEPAQAAAPSESDYDRAELRAMLDEEVRKLPGKFRDPIILCYLDGLTHDEAAVQLDCPVGTVRSRLATGRARLRDRLGRRGVTVPATLFAGVLTAEAASAAVSPVLLLATARASIAFASSITGATTAGLVSASVASLAEGVTSTMIVSKLKIIGALALTGILTLGVGGAAAQKLGSSSEEPKTESSTEDTPSAQITALKKQVEAAEARAGKLEAELKDLKRSLEARTVSNQSSADGASNKATAPTSTSVSSGTGQQYSLGGVGTTKPTAASGSGQKINRSTNLSQGDSDMVAASGAMSGQMAMIATATGGKSPRSYPLGSVSGQGAMMAEGSGIATYKTDQFVIVHKPKSDKVAAYSNETGEWTSYQVPQALDVSPIFSRTLVALYFKGDSINQIATYIPQLGQWYPIDLKEPAKGNATPIVNTNLAVYALGRRVYGFSTAAHGWDILELPEGAKPGVVTTSNTATVEHGDTVYLFNASRGKWTSFNAKTGEAGQSDKK